MYEDLKTIKRHKKDDPKVKAMNESGTYLIFVEAGSSKGTRNYVYTKALYKGKRPKL